MSRILTEADIIRPDWQAPAGIQALVTTRHGGCSDSPYDELNIAGHVGDNSDNVRSNRQMLAALLPSEPVWLNQVHSNTVVDAAETAVASDADGSYSTRKNVVSVVMTADCLPVLMCNRQGSAVAALHAGWRGLANGILEQGVEQLLRVGQCTANELLVWFGPAIGPRAFEVGEEVRQAFLVQAQQQTAENRTSFQQAIEQCFTPSVIPGKWLADIYQLARVRLSLLGVENCSGGNYCTYHDRETFFSYRRDGKTGRMASLIWITDYPVLPGGGKGLV